MKNLIFKNRESIIFKEKSLKECIEKKTVGIGILISWSQQQRLSYLIRNLYMLILTSPHIFDISGAKHIVAISCTCKQSQSS